MVWNGKPSIAPFIKAEPKFHGIAGAIIPGTDFYSMYNKYWVKKISLLNLSIGASEMTEKAIYLINKKLISPDYKQEKPIITRQISLV
jgi:hypothetical protein